MHADTLAIILNWNNAVDTAAAALAVLREQGADVIIVDNHSSDDSKPKIAAILSREAVSTSWEDEANFSLKGRRQQCYLLAASRNYGFAAGVNKVLRHATETSYRFFWLLNNDAFPAPAALSLLKEALIQDQGMGFAGSVIADYQDRNRVQCCGVKYYPFFGVSKLVLKNELLTAVDPARLREERIDFQHGASLLLSRNILETIGFMDERFFLYFEEHDWQLRASAHGLHNCLVPESLVYHKGSMSTDNAKHLFFYYYNSSAVVFSLKHNPWPYRISSILNLVLITAVRTRLRPKSFTWGIKGLYHGIKKYRHAPEQG